MVISAVQETNFTVNFTNGNGVARLLVVRQTAAPEIAPTDGTIYTVGTNTGNGNTVVYVGNGSGPVSVSYTHLDVYKRQDLVRSPLLKQRNLKFVHYNSPDVRGVDVAMLYNPRYFTPLFSAPLFVKLPTGSKAAYYTCLLYTSRCV